MKQKQTGDSALSNQKARKRMPFIIVMKKHA